MFGVEAEQGMIAKEHRAGFLPILIRVLLPKLMKRKTGGLKVHCHAFDRFFVRCSISLQCLYLVLTGDCGCRVQSTVAARRAAIFAFLSGLAPSELVPLFQILLASFDHLLEQAGISLKDGVLPASTDPVFAGGDDSTAMLSVYQRVRDACVNPACIARSSSVPVGKQVGFLRLLQFLVSRLRNRMMYFLPHVMVVSIGILHNAQRLIDSMPAEVAHAPDDVIETAADDSGADDASDVEAAGTSAGLAGLVPSASLAAKQVAIRKRQARDLRTVRQLCLQRLSQVLEMYPVGAVQASLEVNGDAMDIDASNHQQQEQQEEQDEDEPADTIRQATAITAGQSGTHFATSAWLPYLSVAFESTASYLKLMPQHAVHSRGGIWTLIVTCSRHIPLLSVFFWRLSVHDDGTVIVDSDLLSQKARSLPVPVSAGPSTVLSLLPLVAHCLMVPHTHSAVFSAGLELLENLLHVTDVVALRSE